MPGSNFAEEIDPIMEANELKDNGDTKGARKVLMELCRQDLRCLDAHAHLGNLVYQRQPEIAMKHYEVGVRIGELSLGEGFDGVLPWGLIDNRPFMRCYARVWDSAVEVAEIQGSGRGVQEDADAESAR